MRHIPETSLWIGNAGDLRAPHVLYEVEVEIIIDLADNEPIPSLPRDLVYCRIPLSDDAGNPPWRLDLAVRTVVQGLEANRRCLVCCSAGMSRSVAVGAAALAEVDSVSFEAALKRIAEAGPCDVSPALALSIQNQVRGD